MKIAVVDPSLFTWPYDSELAMALVAAGNEVQIIGRPPRPIEESGAGLDLLVPHFYRSLRHPIIAKGPPRLVSIWKGLTHARGMAGLGPLLSTWEPDVIHFQWAPLPVVDHHYLRALKRVSKTVLTVHDSTPFNGTPRAGARLSQSIKVMLAVDRLIVHTEGARLRLLGYGIPSRRVHVVPHGPLQRYSVVSGAHSLPATGEVSILMFGYLKPYKGIDVLIAAVAAMSSAARAIVKVHVVGKQMMDLAPLREMISSLDLDQVVRLDARFVPDSEVAQLFDQADIVVLPYRQIDASGVLVTAMAAGSVVVASRLGLAAEILENRKHAVLVEPGESGELSRALEALVMSPVRRQALRQNMTALHSSLPTWATIARETTDIYEALLSE